MKLSYVGFAALLGGVGLVALTAGPAKAADTVKGQIVYAGTPPQPKQLNVIKDQQHCLSKGPILSEELVVNPANKGVKNVFVWLTKEDGTKPPIPPALAKPKEKEVYLDQPVCAFVPHAMAVREGQDVVMKNTAPVTHNVNWSGGPKNPGDNKILPAGKELKMTPKLKADNKRPVAVSCNIHGWMKGWIRVFDHPYYAVTDADGKFEIKDAPVGDYKIWYWSDTGWKDGAKGANGFPIKIKPGENDLKTVEWK